MSVKNRLKEYIRSKNKSINSYEKEISVSQGYVNSISKGIGGEILLAIIEKSPDLNINWLLSGEGNMLKTEAKNEQNINTISGGIFTNGGNINIENPTTETLYQQEILRLSSENKNIKREAEILERDILSYKELLEQLRENQNLIKELYERKVEDLKRTISILETQIKINNDQKMS